MPKHTKANPTMNDVARLAGVSQTTVSFVINENPSIPVETKDRVLAAISELGYRPNAAARNMRTQRTNMIGMIADEIATTPYAGQIIKGAQDAAWKKGKTLFIVNIDNEPRLECQGLELLLEHQVEGILYAAMFHHPVKPSPSLYETRVVMIDCFVSDASLPSVVPDEVDGGYQATRYFIERGHRKIGFICNVDDIPATHGRMQGYCQALADAGREVQPAFIRNEHSDSKGGYRAAMDLFQQADHPTAVFCFNDRMAMGVYDALRKLDLRIPEDVAVIGFDNQEIISDNLYPGLTTLQLPHYEMGVWGANYLIESLEAGAISPPVQHKIACPLIVRDSA